MPSDCFSVRTPANRSPCCSIRARTASGPKAFGSSPSRTSSQRSGVETGRARMRPHRVGRRDRLALAVLVRVDQDAAPLRLRPLGRDQPAVGAGERAGDDLGELARLVVRVPPLDRHEHVHAVAAARLRETGEPERVEHLLDEQRDLDRPRGTRRRRRGRGRRGRSRAAPGLSTREYHVFRSMQPMFTIQSSASSSLTSGTWIFRRCRGESRVETSNSRRRDPVRHVPGRVLLEEVPARDPVGVALHRERPVLQMCGSSDGRDRAVVREQVALGQPVVGEEDLVEVGELERALARPGSRPAAAPPRCTSRADLSSRSPWNDGARRRPSCVHSTNSTSQTSSGLTQTTSAFLTFGIFGTTGNGRLLLSRAAAASRAARRCPCR